MSRIILLYSTLIIGCLFLLIPDTVNPVDFFILSDYKIHGASYVYYFSEKLIPIILSLIIAKESNEYGWAGWVFFWMCVFDLIDYLISYGQWNLYLGSFPITYNIVKVFIGCIVMLTLWIQYQQEKH